MSTSRVKKKETLFNRNGEVISLPPTSRGLYLLMKIRDEAHRFAITYHRKIRRKKLRASVLDEIPGIGEKRKMALLAYFMSVDAIKKASEEDIARVAHVGKSTAKLIYDTFHR
jgi:excinuclease ABC subunit C